MSETTSRSDDADPLPPSLQPGYREPLPPQIQLRPAMPPQLGGTSPQLPPQLSGGEIVVRPGARPGAFPPAATQPLPAPPASQQQPPEPEQVAVVPPLRPQPAQQPPQQPAPQYPGLDQSLVIDPTGRNNPGNMRTIGGRGPTGFQRFPTMQAGIQAMQNQLLRYQDVYGKNTIAGVIGLWTPPNENNTELAIQYAEQNMGIDRHQRFDMHDPATMAAMTNAILFNEQHGNRGRPMRIGLNQAIPDIGDARAQMKLPQPQQNYVQSEVRGSEDWGHPSPVMGGRGPTGEPRPGEMPKQSDFGRIMSGIAPLLLGIASIALRLPLSTAITAYGAMSRAQQNGQELEYERNRTRHQDALKESTAQQIQESRDASDAFSEYGHNNPEGLQQALMQVALKHNDPIMYRMAERGDLNGIYQMQQKRDAYNQDLSKLHKAQQDEEQRQTEREAAGAKFRQWHDKFVQDNGREPTADEAAIKRNEIIGEVARAGSKDPAGDHLEPTKTYDVVKDGKVDRTVQLRERKDQPGFIDADTGQPFQKGPGETLVPRSTAANRPQTPRQSIEKSHLDAADAKTRQWAEQQRAKGHDPTPDEWTIHRDQELDKSLQAGRAGGGELEPYTGPSTWEGAPNVPPPDDPDITPGIWAQALQLAQRGAPVPLGRNSPAAAAIRKAYPVAQEVLGISPAESAQRAMQYNADNAAMTAVSRYFASSQAASQMRSLNTVAGHIELFRRYAAALQTGDEQSLNKIGQAMAVELGKPEVTNFRVAGTLMADEIVRLLTNTGGTVGDRERMEKRFAEFMGQDQLSGAADVAENFVRERFDGLQVEWVHPPGVMQNERQIGQRTAQFREMLGTASRQMFDRPPRPIPGEPTQLNQPAQPAQPSGTTATPPSWAAPQSKPAYLQDGRTIWLKPDNKWYFNDQTLVPGQ